MQKDRGIGAIFRKKYCLGDSHICARFLVWEKLGADYVPQSLYPNMTDVAESLIKTHQISIEGKDD
jgi:hypothetical protein